MNPYTVIYALVRPRQPNQRRVVYAPSDACYHHVVYVTAAYVDEAIERCRQDALPGLAFHLIVAFHGHVNRYTRGDGVDVHHFDFEDQACAQVRGGDDTR